MPLLVQCVRLSFLCGNIIRARRKYALKSLFLCAARRLALFMPFARFLLLAFYGAFHSFARFLFLVFMFGISIFLPLCCYLLFAFLYLLTYFISFPLSLLSYSWYYLITIINNKYISIISLVCAYVCTRARARQRRGKIRHKKRAAFLPPSACYPKKST